jgi:REP-associated tyrosine transposase
VAATLHITHWRRLTRLSTVMPRRPGRATGQLVFHVLNRAVQNTVLFESEEDYQAFMRLFIEATDRVPMRLLAYALMPTHWHLVLWPEHDGQLSEFMRWLTARHAESKRIRDGDRGRGAVYQGRFKAIAVQCDAHFLRLCRYVERNPLRARLVAEAENWEWSSAYRGGAASARPRLASWPVAIPADWLDELNGPERGQELEAIRKTIKRGRHFGEPEWRESVARGLGWRGGRGSGRPAVLRETTHLRARLDPTNV